MKVFDAAASGTWRSWDTAAPARRSWPRRCCSTPAPSTGSARWTTAPRSPTTTKRPSPASTRSSAVARLPRVEQAQNQPHRHARHGQLPDRRARGAARRRSGGRRRRRRRRRPGLDRKGRGRRPTSCSCRASSSATGWTASAPASSARSSRCATTLGRNCIPVQLPIGEETAFHGRRRSRRDEGVHVRRRRVRAR